MQDERSGSRHQRVVTSQVLKDLKGLEGEFSGAVSFASDEGDRACGVYCPGEANSPFIDELGQQGFRDPPAGHGLSLHDLHDECSRWKAERAGGLDPGLIDECLPNLLRIDRVQGDSR